MRSNGACAFHIENDVHALRGPVTSELLRVSGVLKHKIKTLQNM